MDKTEEDLELELRQPTPLEDDEDQLFPEQAAKAAIRDAISEQAGDMESLLGTTADATRNQRNDAVSFSAATEFTSTSAVVVH